MIEVYQAEWCPHSHRVRSLLTELGVDFIARQVPAEPGEREAMRRATGTDEIPAVVVDDGHVLTGDTDAILAALDERFQPRFDAAAHRAQAEQT